MDLANISTVRDFANRALDVGKPLDILINNAGAVSFLRKKVLKSCWLRNSAVQCCTQKAAPKRTSIQPTCGI